MGSPSREDSGKSHALNGSGSLNSPAAGWRHNGTNDGAKSDLLTITITDPELHGASLLRQPGVQVPITTVGEK